MSDFSLRNLNDLRMPFLSFRTCCFLELLLKSLVHFSQIHILHHVRKLLLLSLPLRYLLLSDAWFSRIFMTSAITWMLSHSSEGCTSSWGSLSQSPWISALSFYLDWAASCLDCAMGVTDASNFVVSVSDFSYFEFDFLSSKNVTSLTFTIFAITEWSMQYALDSSMSPMCTNFLFVGSHLFLCWPGMQMKTQHPKHAGDS